jgi:hypothetical protein
MPAKDSFLLRVLDAGTSAWVQKYSLVAIPPLRPLASVPPAIQQRNRDIFVLCMFGASVSAAALCYQPDVATDPPAFLQASAAFGLYRAADLFVALVRTGVFFSFRGDIRVNEEPPWRLQRVLIGVMFNYVELMMWFSVAYLQLAATSACQFGDKVHYIHQALNLSFTTMTTIGYGVYAPDSLLSTVIAMWQALAGITLLAIVVAVVLALLSSTKTTADPSVITEEKSWFRPVGAFVVIYGALYLLAGLKYC